MSSRLRFKLFGVALHSLKTVGNTKVARKMKSARIEMRVVLGDLEGAVYSGDLFDFAV